MPVAIIGGEGSETPVPHGPPGPPGLPGPPGTDRRFDRRKLYDSKDRERLESKADLRTAGSSLQTAPMR